jgi:hypothetical protein
MATILMDGGTVSQVATKSEAPKVETPKVVEAPKSQPVPQDEPEISPLSPEMQKVLSELGALKAELAKTQADLEASRVKPPVPVEVPKVEVPKVEAPKVETPPVAEAPKNESPKVEVLTKVELLNCPKSDAHWIDFVVTMYQNKVAPRLPSESKKTLSEAIANGEVVKLSEGSQTLSLFVKELESLVDLPRESLSQELLCSKFNKMRNYKVESFHPEVLAVLGLIEEWKRRGKNNEPNWELVKFAAKNAPKESAAELVKDVTAYKQELQTLTTPSLRPKAK